MPHTGGAYSFARAALGPWGGFITGLAESIEYVVTTAVVVYFSAIYANIALDAFFGFQHRRVTGCTWIVLYAIFVLVNWARRGDRLPAGDHRLDHLARDPRHLRDRRVGDRGFDPTSCGTSSPTLGRARFLPHGFGPVLLVIPFAMWFFLGIEELPLASEETHNPTEGHPARRHHRADHTVDRGGSGLHLQHRRARRRTKSRSPAATARRIRTDGAEEPRRRARDLRADRPAGLAAGHHVRVRSQPVLAVACRVLPEVCCRSPASGRPRSSP